MIDSRQLSLPGVERDYLGVPPPALCAPIIKYAGGKSWLVSLITPRIHCHLANVSGIYVEPMCGGLACGLGIGWPRSVFSDRNADLMNLYRAVGLDPESVADRLDQLMEEGVSEADYYRRREVIWPENRDRLDQFSWAAHVVYLNKTSYNGLWRVNRKGQFNVPWGRREPRLPSRGHLTAASAILRQAWLLEGDFEEVVSRVRDREDPRRCVFVFDPPYGGVLDDSTVRGPRRRIEPAAVFTGYTMGGFSWSDQVRLGQLAAELARAGSLVIASNTWTDAVCDLYRENFTLFSVGVQHAVGATGARRGRRLEMLAVSAEHSAVFEASAGKLHRIRV